MHRRMAAAQCVAAGLGLVAAMAWTGALAQGYPVKPVHIVVPFPPGGAVDAISRIVGQRLGEQMAQPVIIDNRPGANANLGTEQVAKSAPDGYTLLMAAPGLATNMTLFPNLNFHAIRDFSPVAQVGFAPLVLVVAPSFPVKTVKELLALARQQPGKLSYASTGNGSSQHLAAELLKLAAQIDVLHVPYKGGAPALVDVIGGRISFMLQNPVEVLPHIRAGRLRAVAVGSTKRISLLPEAPTLIEAGVPGYEATVWWGLVAPGKTPREIVSRLNAETVKALGDAGVKDKLGEQGVVINTGTPEQFAEFLKSEIDKWAKVIRTSGIRAD